MDKKSYNPEIWGGIECTINRVNHQFFDQLDYSGHYERTGDLQHIADLGIKKIRYPVLWEKHQPERNSVIDWSWTRERLQELREKNIDVIAGLLHHGSGPKFTDLADPDFPRLLAGYARSVAEEFPWIEYYTPVNEPVTTARFSGLYGLWYPHRKSSEDFVRMLLHQLKGIVLSMQEIRKVNPQAKLVQTEDLGKTYSTPALQYQADFENERRWLTYDVLCGRFDERHALWSFVRNFATRQELYFFLDNPCVPELFGFNHYLTSERYLDERVHLYPTQTHGGNGHDRYADVEAVRVDIKEETGLTVLLKEAWHRYQKPMVLTEVHLHSHREEQLRWFQYVWKSVHQLNDDGIPVRALTSWALLGSHGWNKLLTEPGGDYEPGAFDLRGGRLRPTALASFIKGISHHHSGSHPLSHESGWWQRSSRILYGSVLKEIRRQIPLTIAPVLILGKTGTLGKAFARICAERCIPYRILGREDCDISQPDQVDHVLQECKPWALINATGYVRVDDAEKEQEACFRDNTRGPGHLALACHRRGIQLIHFSSDLVFDGRKKTPYLETDETNPLNVYGKSKAMSEKLVLEQAPDSLVIRTSAFFGPWDEYNFVHYVRQNLEQYRSIKVARDIYISPTYVPDLVHATLDLMIDKERGIWHLANKGITTWADLAWKIADRFDLDRSLIERVDAQCMSYAATRPAYSILGSEKGWLLPSFEQAFNRYVTEVNKEKRKVA